MGKRTKLHEAKRQKLRHAVSAVLQAHSRRDAPARAAFTFADFKPHDRQKVEAYRSLALRPPEDWRCRIKSRADDRRFLDLVRFTFARYPVAAHLENVWVVPFDDDFVDRMQPRTRRAHAWPHEPDLRAWYIVVAQGGSLHKRASHPYMTKLETHHFLAAPDGTTVSQAFWYAFARAQTGAIQVARTVARAKLNDYSVASTFWKDAARYFARNPMPLHDINDMIDYLHAAKEQDGDFSLKGRSPQALRRRMEDWHRALRKEQANAGGAWAGSPLPDIDYETGQDERRAIWHFRQIKTGHDLFREGQRMHHCVATYKNRCMSGDVSIWSLTSEFPIGQHNRGVTIELHRSGIVAQCRGFANRLPYGNELAMIRRWANDHRLSSFALPA